jgi:hypothetical protein
MRVSLKKAILQHLTRPIGPVILIADPVQGAIATARRLLRVHAA